MPTTSIKPRNAASTVSTVLDYSRSVRAAVVYHPPPPTGLNMQISQGELEIIKQSIKTAKGKLVAKSVRTPDDSVAIQALDNALFRIEQAEQTQ